MDKKTEKLQSLLNAQVGKRGVMNIVAAVQSYDKRFDFVGAAGVANPSPDPGEVAKATNGTPMTPENPYFIASITKMYTAAIAMQLQSEKKLDLEAPLASYLPSSHLDGIHVYNFEERICPPLGLQKTYLYEWTKPRPGDSPAAIYLNNAPAPVLKYLSYNVSDGGLVSTASECMLFLRAFMEGKLFEKGLLDRMMI